MTKPGIIDVRNLFPELYSELVTVLKGLTPEEWNSPTSSSRWTVKDITAHLLDVDLRRISFQRDEMTPPPPGKPVTDYNELVEFLNVLNNTWVTVSQRLSPGVLLDLLQYTSIEIPKLLNSLDLKDKALFNVAWAGEEESENWFDIAREYTERWYHQQQIREAVGEKLLTGKKWVYPLIDTFIRALPNLYNNKLPDTFEAEILINIEDIPEAKWILKKERKWELYVGESSEYSTRILLNSDTAWRMFSRNITKDEAKSRIFIDGDEKPGLVILDLISFMK